MRLIKRIRRQRFLASAFSLMAASLLWVAGAAAAQPAGQEIQIAADSFTANTAENYAEFIGNVQAVQGAFEILSDSLRVYYKADNSGNRDPLAVTNAEIKEIVASGNVRITTEDRKAETEKAVYRMDDQQLVLSGENSILSSDRNFIRGSTITFNRLTRRVTIIGNDSDRVSGSFYSDTRPQKDPGEAPPGVVFLTPPPKRAATRPAPAKDIDSPPADELSPPKADIPETASEAPPEDGFPEVGTTPDSLPVVEELVAYQPPQDSEPETAEIARKAAEAVPPPPEKSTAPLEQPAADAAATEIAPQKTAPVVPAQEVDTPPSGIVQAPADMSPEADAQKETTLAADTPDLPQEPAAPEPPASDTTAAEIAPQKTAPVVPAQGVDTPPSGTVQAPADVSPEADSHRETALAADTPDLPQEPAAPEPPAADTAAAEIAPQKTAPVVPAQGVDTPPTGIVQAPTDMSPEADAHKETPLALDPPLPPQGSTASKTPDPGSVTLPQPEPTGSLTLARAHTEPLVTSPAVVPPPPSIPVVPLKNLTKRVGVALFENTTVFPDKGFGILILDQLTKTIREENSDVALLLPGDPEYPGIFIDLPRQASGYINNLLMVQAGRSLGLRAIVTGTLVDIKIMTEPTGFWIFKGSRVFARVVVQVAMYDTETGTKFLDEMLVRKITVDEGDLYTAQKGQAPEIPGLEEVLTDMAQTAGETIGETLADLKWRGFIVSADRDRVVLSAGSLSGLVAGNELVVYDETPITGLAGHRYNLPGQKVGKIQLITLHPNRSEAIVVSGRYVREGLSVADPDDDTAGKEGWAQRLKFW